MASLAQQAEPEGQPEGQFEPDQWLIDFASLFRDHLGVEPDRHLDLLSLGWDKLQVRILADRDLTVIHVYTLPTFHRVDRHENEQKLP